MEKEGRPFYKHWYPCGYCGEEIEVQEIFFHHGVKHNSDYVEYSREDGEHRCTICGDVVPEARDWCATFDHFGNEHNITIIDYDDPNA